MEESNKLPKNPIYNSSAFKWNLQDKASSLSAYTYMREGYNYSSPHYSSESSSLGTRNSIFTEDFLKKIQSDSKLSSEIAALKSEVSSKSAEVNKFKADAIEREAAIKSLEDANKKLNAKIQIQHIASRISTEANERLMVNSKFQELFDNLSSYETTVVSIDIRRSTELMLKAKNAVYFSDFINNLRTILFNIIISNYGVFDKFTGDGILAFYSGEESIIRAIKATNECHLAFEEHYKNSRSYFTVVPKDTGLGIGIDFGMTTLMNTQNELTVVGVPVVYACRFSGAKAGETLLNQSAKEELERLCSQFVNFSESELFIKNEGNTIAYKASLHKEAYNIVAPDWDTLTQKYTKPQEGSESQKES